MLKTTAATIAIALAASTACWAQGQPNPQTGSAQVSNDAKQTMNSTDRMTSPGDNDQNVDLEFFKAAASGNNMEIKAGQLALERTSNPQVKQLAQMLIRDHTQANQVLQETCQKNNLSVPMDQMDPVDQATLNSLQEKQGDTFTHNFVWDLAGDHLKDVMVFSYHANMAKNPITRQYAAQILPKLQEHLRAIESIARPMVGAVSFTNGAGSTAETSYWTENPSGGK